MPLTGIEALNLIILKPVIACGVSLWLLGHLKFQSAHIQKHMLRTTFFCLILLPFFYPIFSAIELPVFPDFSAGINTSSSWLLETSTSLVYVLLSVYMIGFSLHSYKLIADIYQLKKTTQKAEAVDLSDWPIQMQGLLADLPVTPEVRLSPRVSTPAVWGLFRPVILLPKSFVSEPDDRQLQIILHEATHIKCFDWAMLIVSRASCCFFWHIPWSWALQRKLAEATESACDNTVLEAGHASHSYAKTLVEGAKSSRWKAALSLIAKPFLYKRTEAILDRFISREKPSHRLKSAMILSGVIFISALSLIQVTVFTSTPIDKAFKTIPLMNSVDSQLVSSKELSENNMPEAIDQSFEQFKDLALTSMKTVPLTENRQNFASLGSDIESEINGKHTLKGVTYTEPPVLGNARFRPVKASLPVYPRRAIKLKKQGSVLVGFQVSSDGLVVHEQIISAKPAGYFEKSVLDAIKKFQFKAVTKGESTAPVFLTTVFQFSLSANDLEPAVAFIYHP